MSSPLVSSYAEGETDGGETTNATAVGAGTGTGVWVTDTAFTFLSTLTCGGASKGTQGEGTAGGVAAVRRRIKVSLSSSSLAIRAVRSSVTGVGVTNPGGRSNQGTDGSTTD